MWNPSGTRDNSFISKSTASTTQNRASMGFNAARGSVPTAKVPSYMNRVKQSTRDMRPGLLPTPNFPPMRPAELTIEAGYVERGTCGQNHGRGRSLVCEDVYATPYADYKKTGELDRAGSATSNSNSLYSEYSLTTPSSVHTRSKRPEEYKNLTQQNNREGLDDEDIISSLLKLLIGSETTQEEVNVDLMESIAGFYLPSNNDTT